MHASRFKQFIVTALITLSVSACSLQSDYVTPELSGQARWNTETTSPADARSDLQPASDTWWSALNDPAINALIEATFAGNPTLDKAVARLDEARAQVGVNRADYFPTLSASGSITEANTKVNNAGSGSAGDSAGAAASTGMLVGRSRTTAVGPSLTWELDLFGRVRSSVAASRRRLDARTADAQSARLALAAQVATTTLDWRACTHSVEVDAAEIESREKTLTLMRRKLAAGFAAQVEVASVTRDFAAAQSTLVAQQESCARSVNALVELSNLDRDALLKVLTQPLPAGDAADVVSAFMPTPPAATLELPATVLLAHPSVVAADREAAAAWAEIGVARADRLPKLDLSAALTGQWIRYAGSTLSLTSWSVGPALAGTLFDFGKGKGNVNAAQARYRQSAADLQATVRATVKEVENALAAQQSAATRLNSSQQSEAAAQVVFNAMQARWDNGTASLLELEDARRQYAIAKDSVITAARDRASAWVELIRASANNLTSTSNSPHHEANVLPQH